MNVFSSVEGILGDTATHHMNCAFAEMLDQSLIIRDKLGNQAYIFDRYLSLLLGAAIVKTGQDIINLDCFGGETAGRMCIEILRHKPKLTQNPVYDIIESYVTANPLPYQEEATQQAIYCAILSGSILENAAEMFNEGLSENFRSVVDIVELNDLYKKICATLGGENEMEKLNLLFRQRFLVATPTPGTQESPLLAFLGRAAVFLQEITNQLISMLLRRDFETSKQIFQLILDEMSRG